MIVTYNGTGHTVYKVELTAKGKRLRRALLWLAAYYLRHQQNLRGSASVWLIPGTYDE
jgi:hypothetical protein